MCRYSEPTRRPYEFLIANYWSTPLTKKLADRIGRASRDLPMASAETAPAELDLLEAVQALDALDRQRAR
ncbi:MAG: hypothetical protein F4Z34_06445 [Acidimicrobiaceae bacterium]|nr:hypothetical protein [Acidimicrobiaceae bacterium]